MPSRDVTLDVMRGALSVTLDAEARAATDNPYAALVETRAFHPDVLSRLVHVAVRRQGRLLAVVSAHRVGPAVVVVNQCVEIDGEARTECARRLLDEHPGTSRVEWTNAVVPPEGLQSPMWRKLDRDLMNYVVDLPATVEEFDGRSHARTRQRRRNRERRLLREFPQVRVDQFAEEAIDTSVVEAIIGLNHARMKARGGVSVIDRAFADGLIALARACGRVCVVRDGDRVLAGTISASVGRGWTLMVVAHDPAFDAHSLGQLCMTRTVEAAIRDGAARFNLMPGRYEYKVRLGAQTIALADYRYYRSTLAALGDLPSVLPVIALRVRRGLQAARIRLHLGRFIPRSWRQA